MAFFGTALCGSKVGQGYYSQRYYETKFGILEDIIEKGFDGLKNKYGVEKISDSKYNFDGFDFIEYYKDNYFNYNSWYENSSWNVVKALGYNALWTMPVSLMSTAFHDYYGRDLTKSINEHFKSDISPYLVNAGIFGMIGTVGTCCLIILCVKDTLNDFTKPWIYSMSIMEGFMVGATAGLAAYFADETDDQINSEILTELEPYESLQGL